MDVFDDNPGRHGNFQALIRFCIEAGDKVLEEHLKQAGGRAVYTSKESQNEFLVACGFVIQQKIVVKIQVARYFSVIADEATDASNEEQLSISIRFVYGDTVAERFLGFYSCHASVTGEAIAKGILQKLTEWQLDTHLLRGQAYDSAGSMAGKSKGVAAVIARLHPKVLYTHRLCFTQTELVCS